MNRSAVMKRAWEIFRDAYSDRRTALTRGERKSSFGTCLMLAWRSAKEADAAAKRTPAEARVAVLRRSIETESMSDCWSLARNNIAAMQVEIDTLTAAVRG